MRLRSVRKHERVVAVPARIRVDNSFYQGAKKKKIKIATQQGGSVVSLFLVSIYIFESVVQTRNRVIYFLRLPLSIQCTIHGHSYYNPTSPLVVSVGIIIYIHVASL